jgi:hypothetical protein
MDVINMNKTLNKIFGYLVIYLVVVFVLFMVFLTGIAYIVDFNYFFWNSGAIPFSAWWNLGIENFTLLMISSLIFGIPGTVWFLKDM